MFFLKRKDFIESSGERFSLLVDESGIPDFWITLFMTTIVRSYTHSTQRAYLNHLYHLSLWEEKIKTRLPDRIITASQKKVIMRFHFSHIPKFNYLLNIANFKQRQLES